MGKAAWAAAALGVAAAGIGCKDASSLHEASASIAPYRAVFARFDGWARRTQATARVTPNRRALDEATFAPVRNTQVVLAAWVERESQRDITLAMPASAPPPQIEGWVSLRDDELGTLRVAAHSDCPIEVPRWWRQGRGQGPCVLASRSERAGVDDELVVTMAFAPREARPQ